MKKRVCGMILILLALSLMLTTASYAAEKAAGTKNFWQRLFNYPAKATQESASVVADTTKRSANVVAKEVKTTGQVATGEFEKTKDLVVEPIKGTAETGGEAVKGTVYIPIKAAEEEPAQKQ